MKYTKLNRPHAAAALPAGGAGTRCLVARQRSFVQRAIRSPMLMVSVSGSEGTAAQEPVRGSCTCRTRTCQWTCQWTRPGQQPSGRVLHLEPAVALAAPLHGPLQDGEALVVGVLAITQLPLLARARRVVCEAKRAAGLR